MIKDGIAIASRLEGAGQQATSSADLEELLGQAKAASTHGDRLATSGSQSGADRELKALHDLVGTSGLTSHSLDQLTEALKHVDMAHLEGLVGDRQVEANMVKKLVVARPVREKSTKK